MEPKQLFSKTRSWTIGCILAAWFICISGVFGNSGLVQAYQLASVRRDMTLRVKALANERQYLQAGLYALEHDALVQEQAIRETLGFVRAYELIFEFR